MNKIPLIYFPHITGINYQVKNCDLQKSITTTSDEVGESKLQGSCCTWPRQVQYPVSSCAERASIFVICTSHVRIETNKQNLSFSKKSFRNYKDGLASIILIWQHHCFQLGMLCIRATTPCGFSATFVRSEHKYSNVQSLVAIWGLAVVDAISDRRTSIGIRSS